MSDRHELIHLLLEHSVRWGDFTLKSGKKSDLYVDVRQTALHPEGSVAIAEAILHHLDLSVRAVGGVELGAVPIIGSVITGREAGVYAWNEGQWDGPGDDVPLPGFIVRKAAKGHGTKSKIENCPPAGTKVAIIEDVTTTGGSLEKAITAAQLAGLDVVQAIVVVDREEGAEDFLRAGGFEGAFTAIVTRANLSV